ncbi:hypothetical protein EVAR_95098_1 [Eumeta japonica]|uniref:Uncharacterized protein n=1 Tax=Eumeta variegata TaxID=151549 RepID=A0A4C1W549_EUMVA|nr:hypothetical protein EVAR_95098_1 [Eumeta japonica]
MTRCFMSFRRSVAPARPPLPALGRRRAGGYRRPRPVLINCNQIFLKSLRRTAALGPAGGSPGTAPGRTKISYLRKPRCGAGENRRRRAGRARAAGARARQLTSFIMIVIISFFIVRRWRDLSACVGGRGGARALSELTDDVVSAVVGHYAFNWCSI